MTRRIHTSYLLQNQWWGYRILFKICKDDCNYWFISSQGRQVIHQAAHFLQAAVVIVLAPGTPNQKVRSLEYMFMLILKISPFSIDIADLFRSCFCFTRCVKISSWKRMQQFLESPQVLRMRDAETILRQANRQDIVMNRCNKESNIWPLLQQNERWKWAARSFLL